MRKLSAVVLATSVVSFAVVAQEAPPTPPAAPPAAPAGAAADPAVAALAAAKEAFKKGNCPEALEASLKVLETQATNLEALYIAGACERQTNKLAEAEGHLKTLLTASPQFPLAHFQLGYDLFLEAEEAARGGQVEPAKAKYAEAADEFGRELARNATHAASLSSRAIALTRAGKLDDAVPAHEAWIAAAPQKNDPVVSLAATYAAAGKSTEAMATLDRLPDKSENAVMDATLAAAGTFIAKRDWGAAIPFLEKAAGTSPATTRPRALLGQAAARAGLADDAAKHLQTLLSMDPTPEEAEAVGEAIKASFGDGTTAPPRPGVQLPVAVRIPPPRYPKGQDPSVQTDVLVFTLVKVDGTVGQTLLVPNRIWKDIRSSGFEEMAFEAVRRGKFTPGTKDEHGADLWIVVPVKFTRP